MQLGLNTGMHLAGLAGVGEALGMKSHEPHHDPLATPHEALHYPRFTHPEAFRLMVYESEHGHVVETIWNSRDGAAPLEVVSHREHGDLKLRQVLSAGDSVAPLYIPNFGSYIFVTTTRGRPRLDGPISAIEPVEETIIVRVDARIQEEFIKKRIQALEKLVPMDANPREA